MSGIEKRIKSLWYLTSRKNNSAMHSAAYLRPSPSTMAASFHGRIRWNKEAVRRYITPIHTVVGSALQMKLERRFIPKGSSFDELTDEDLARITHYINTLPRKRFGYKSSMELWNAQIHDMLAT